MLSLHIVIFWFVLICISINTEPFLADQVAVLIQELQAKILMSLGSFMLNSSVGDRQDMIAS